MSLQKWLWAAMALCVTAGVASADPMRTVFTKENKFPGALGTELSLFGGGTSYDPEIRGVDDVTTYSVGPGVRFGVTDRLALRADVPYVGYSNGDLDESGMGDVELGTDFLFYEDIFEYGWIIPHATAILATGDEDKGLGTGETQGRFGVSAGTTVNDVIHCAADVSYTMNGAESDDWLDDEREDLITGALSGIWDLDDRSSLIGEIQIRDDAIEADESTAYRGHLGMAYRINKYVSLMGYAGAASGMEQDFYGMGRLVCQF